MPRPKYRYFRHRLDSHQDPKIIKLMEKGGIAAVGCWFIILEIYGTHAYEKNSLSGVEIHKQYFLNALNKRVNGLVNVLTLLQQCDLLSFHINESLVHLKIPNFPKYFGSYGESGEDQSRIVVPSNKLEVISNKLEVKKENNTLSRSPKSGSEDARKVVEFLNEKSGKNFKPVGANLKMINARLKDYSLEEILGVVQYKSLEWARDPMRQYLRPKTLFAQTNFDSYFGEAQDWLAKEKKFTDFEKELGIED